MGSLTERPNFAHVATLKFVLVGGPEAGHHNNPAETKQTGQAAVWRSEAASDKMAATDQLQFFSGRKNSKLKSKKLFKFYNHIPHDMEMGNLFFLRFY